MKKIAITIISVMIAICFFCGCQEGNNELTKQFIGSWERSDGKIAKYYDNNSIYTELWGNIVWGRYEVVDENTITYTLRGVSRSYSYEFSDKDEFTITDLEDGSVSTYIRKS